MKLKILLFACALCAFAVSGCKKDKDDDTLSLTMTGSFTASIDEYAAPGSTWTYDVEKLSTLEAGGQPIGYYAQDAYSAKKDTLGPGHMTVTFTVKEDLGSYSFRIAAFAEGYYSKTVTLAFTTVDNSLEASLSGLGIKEDDPHFTDPRDGSDYYYTRIGNLDWMKQNLHWNGAGYPYKGYDILGPVFGRYYSWNEAADACPDGWRLPTSEECDAALASAGNDVGRFMADASFNGTALWAYWPETKPSNLSGLCLIPTGYATIAEGKYNWFLRDSKNSEYTRSWLWTSTEFDGDGICRGIFAGENNFQTFAADKNNFATSIRCVREAAN